MCIKMTKIVANNYYLGQDDIHKDDDDDETIKPNKIKKKRSMIHILDASRKMHKKVGEIIRETGTTKFVVEMEADEGDLDKTGEQFVRDHGLEKPRECISCKECEPDVEFQGKSFLCCNCNNERNRKDYHTRKAKKLS